MRGDPEGNFDFFKGAVVAIVVGYFLLKFLGIL